MRNEKLKPGQYWAVDSDVFIDDDDIADFDRVADMVKASNFDPTKPAAIESQTNSAKPNK